MAENQNPNQVIVPVAANQMDGMDVDGDGIYFYRLPELIQKRILEHLDLDSKKEFRLVSKYSRAATDSFVKFPFSWDRHLREGPGNEMAANAGSFKDVLSPLWKFWKNNLIGAMLEVKYIHPESASGETVFWVAKIIKVEGYFVKLRYLSPEEEFGMDENCMDLWVNLFKMDCAHCIGWNMNQDQRLQLAPPPQILDSLLQHYGLVEVEDAHDDGEVLLQPLPPSWPHQFFVRRITDSKTIPYTLSNKCQSALESNTKQRVKVTDMVEVFDTQKHDLLHVGVVRKIHGCRVLIEYQRAEKVQGVWCHHLSEKFQVCGWATTVGYEVVVPPGLHFPYYPPWFPASHMEMDGVLEFYPLQVGMRLEIINPYKPSSIVAGKIARVLKWGNFIFIVRMNSRKVPAHGSAFVCRSVKSLDVFYSGFALENGLPSEAQFDNDNDAELTSVPKELLQKIPLENPFEVDELLEVFDWWEFLLHPAKIVQVTGRLVKVRYLGFSPEMDQWVDVCSRDIYPMGWGDVRDFPIQVPLNFEL